METSRIHRRSFIKSTFAGLALGRIAFAAQQDDGAGIPKRPLGKTGEMVSIIGLGGWTVASIKNEKESIYLIHKAIDEGITFFDNSWDYIDGYAEEVMGKGLASSGKRDKVFQMTKVCARDYKGALSQLEDSLRRLQTDHLDLWQFHGIKYEDDADLVFDEKNGALRAALQAKKEGKVRHIGFTGHQHPDLHLKMLARPFEWETVQMPLNVLDAHFLSFEKHVLPVLNKRDIGVIGMKALASQNGRIVRDVGITAETARRYSLSLPISTLVCGIASRENLAQDINMARNFAPLEEAEVKTLLAKTEPFSRDGRIEQYKIGNYGCDYYHEKMKT